MSVVTIDPNKREPGYAAWVCEQLERGNVIRMEKTPFAPSEEECSWLRDQKQTTASTHKNIAYKPHLNKTTGVDAESKGDAEKLHKIMSAYSARALEFMKAFFPGYAKGWKVDYATFRPVEEEGRDLSMRHRNDLMHVDSFPTRPTHGGRILRMFTNINTSKDRVWCTGLPFEELANKYAKQAGLGTVTGPGMTVKRGLAAMGRVVGLRTPDRSAYDEFMMKFHNFLKESSEFQEKGKAATIAFKPGETWLTFTDQVAHSVLSGQYALEQTCIIPFSAMSHPELAPVSVLEKLAGKQLIEMKWRAPATAGAR